jgi:hypothetical protein
MSCVFVLSCAGFVKMIVADDDENPTLLGMRMCHTRLPSHMAASPIAA